jgi:hypothetical protein
MRTTLLAVSPWEKGTLDAVGNATSKYEIGFGPMRIGG